MSINELLPLVESLSHADKIKLIHFLVSKLASEENISLERNEVTNSVSQLSPKPVGRVYYSGRSDVSVKAEELLFKEKTKEIQQRRENVNR